MQLHEVVRAIVSARDHSDAAAALGHAAALVGAESAVFCTFIAGDEDYQSYRFLIHCGAPFCSAYERAVGFMNDPFLLYASRNTEPIHSSGIRPANVHQAGVMELARSHGFVDAYVIPVHSANGLRQSCLYFGSPEADRFLKTDEGLLRMAGRVLAAEFHDWWLAKTRAEFIEGHRLDSGEIELLRFERQGLTSKEVARKLDSSPAAVHSKFQRLIAKLGASSRRDAARLAEASGVFLGPQ